MQTKSAKFSFAIPEPHAQAGEKIEKTFDYQVCDNDSEAENFMKNNPDGTPRVKPWSLVAMVNDAIKANARSNAYQTALLPYKPSEVPQEDIMERMIRDYIRLGIPEDTARKQVTALLAATSAVTA